MKLKILFILVIILGISHSALALGRVCIDRGLYYDFLVSEGVIFNGNSLAMGTEVSGGGGDGELSEFRAIAFESLGKLFKLGFKVIETSKFNAKQAIEFMKSTDIEIVDLPIVLNGRTVTAVNYPSINKIILNRLNWNNLPQRSKKQLVLHEIIGLTHRGIIDDSNYFVSSILLAALNKSSIEEAVVALAAANSYIGNKAKVQSDRTNIVSKLNSEGGITTEVYVQTFENSSPQSVRIYHVVEDVTGAIVKIILFSSEGPIGP